MKKISDFKTLEVGDKFLFIKDINGIRPEDQEIKWFAVVTSKDDDGFKCKYFALWNDVEEADELIDAHFEYSLAYPKNGWNWWIYKLNDEEAIEHQSKMVLLAI